MKYSLSSLAISVTLNMLNMLMQLAPLFSHLQRSHKDPSLALSCLSFIMMICSRHSVPLLSMHWVSYADDFKKLSLSLSAVNIDLYRILAWCASNCSELNLQKSVLLTFAKRRYPNSTNDLCLLTFHLHRSCPHRDLGSYVSSSGGVEVHVLMTKAIGYPKLPPPPTPHQHDRMLLCNDSTCQAVNFQTYLSVCPLLYILSVRCLGYQTRHHQWSHTSLLEPGRCLAVVTESKLHFHLHRVQDKYLECFFHCLCQQGKNKT